MAGEDRSTPHALIERLEEKPFRHDFFQAVRRLECLYADSAPRIGRSRRSAEDPVRFAQEPSLAFAPSTVSRFVPDVVDGKPGLWVNFFGFLGPNGPMPTHFTEFVYARQHNYSDPTLARFLDLFNHRMLSLFYRAWAVNRQTVSFDRQDEDRYSCYIGSLFGIGMESLTSRNAVPDVAKLHYSGRLACGTRNAEGLEAILQGYFRVPTQLNEFVGCWVDLPPDCHCRLGESPDTGALGQTVVVGSRIWDCQQRFRIRMGPMSLQRYQRLLPGGASIECLADWVRQYIGDEMAWEVQLVLEADEVPATRLGQLGQLGWTTWLKTKPLNDDADDLVLTDELVRTVARQRGRDRVA